MPATCASGASRRMRVMIRATRCGGTEVRITTLSGFFAMRCGIPSGSKFKLNQIIVGTKCWNSPSACLPRADHVLAQRPAQKARLGEPFHQQEKPQLGCRPDLPEREQEKPRIGAVFWFEAVLAEKRRHLRWDTTIPTPAELFVRTAITHEPLDPSPHRDGGHVDQVVRATIQADAGGQRDNRCAPGPQNAVDLFQAAVVSGQIL